MPRCARAVLATAAVLALVAPGWAAADAGAGAGHVTTLHPARLARGADTLLLHLQDGTIVDGRTRIPVPGLANGWLLGRSGTGYLVEEPGPDFRRYAVYLVRHDGSTRVLQRFGQRTTPVPSADGRRLALVVLDRPDTRIRVVRTRTGALVRERSFPTYGVTVTDYGIRRMVITGLRNKTYWWDPQADRVTPLVARPAWADIAADRLVVWTGSPEPTQCQRTVVLSHPSTLLWRSCRQQPLTFAPGGRRMVTIPTLTDGIGADRVQVRRSDGALLWTYRAPGYFGFVAWESPRRVLLQPVGRTWAAAVRCAPARGCVRASRLYRSGGVMEPITSMKWSFP